MYKSVINYLPQGVYITYLTWNLTEPVLVFNAKVRLAKKWLFTSNYLISPFVVQQFVPVFHNLFYSEKLFKKFKIFSSQNKQNAYQTLLWKMKVTIKRGYIFIQCFSKIIILQDMATFVILRHPVTLLCTYFTRPINLTKWSSHFHLFNNKQTISEQMMRFDRKSLMFTTWNNHFA